MRAFFLSISLILISCWTTAVELKLKQSVYRGSKPVKVGDVFVVQKIDESSEKGAQELLNKTLVIAEQRQWVDAHVLLKNSGLSESYSKGRVWFDICNEYSVEHIKSVVKKKVTEKLLDFPVQLDSIEINSVSDTICIPDGVEIDSVKVTWNQHLSNAVRSLVTFSNEQVVTLNWKVEYLVHGIVAPDDFNVNQVVDTRGFKPKWLSVVQVSLSQLMTNYDGEFLVTRRIKKGDLLTYKNVSVAPDVIKGQEVVFVLLKNGLRIESKAKALTSGMKGEYINVLVNGAYSPTKARVVSNGEVNAGF